MARGLRDPTLTRLGYVDAAAPRLYAISGEGMRIAEGGGLLWRRPHTRARGDIVSKDDAIIGVSDHGGWAVLGTGAGGGAMLGRRRTGVGGGGPAKIPPPREGEGPPVHQGGGAGGAGAASRGGDGKARA